MWLEGRVSILGMAAISLSQSVLLNEFRLLSILYLLKQFKYNILWLFFKYNIEFLPALPSISGSRFQGPYQDIRFQRFLIAIVTVYCFIIKAK